MMHLHALLAAKLTFQLSGNVYYCLSLVCTVAVDSGDLEFDIVETDAWELSISFGCLVSLNNLMPSFVNAVDYIVKIVSIFQIRWNRLPVYGDIPVIATSTVSYDFKTSDVCFWRLSWY